MRSTSKNHMLAGFVLASLGFIAVQGIKIYRTDPISYAPTHPSSPYRDIHGFITRPLATVNDSVDVVALNDNEELFEYISEKYDVDKTQVSHIWETVVAETANTNIDPLLMMAVIQVESSYQPTARSSVGALGLTQVMPKVHAGRLERGESLLEPKVSIRVGTEVLAEYLKIENGNLARALQRYNGSLGDPRQRYARHILREKRELERVHMGRWMAAASPHASPRIPTQEIPQTI